MSCVQASLDMKWVPSPWVFSGDSQYAWVKRGSDNDLLMFSLALLQVLYAYESKGWPLLIQVSGSVAVGKTTFAQHLMTTLKQLAPHWTYLALSTDHFLKSNDELRLTCGLDRKGFPESYRDQQLQDFLEAFQNQNQSLPDIDQYSHEYYDHIPGLTQTLTCPNVLILEGVVALNPTCISQQGIGLFIEAPLPCIKQWYIERFMRLRDAARDQSHHYFNRFAQQDLKTAQTIAEQTWCEVNLVNWYEHIMPTRDQAMCHLHKTEDHQWEAIHVPSHWPIRTMT